MNADIIFEEFGGIDSKYILSAEKAIQEKTAAPKPAPKPASKRRLWQRITLAAACLALVIAMIPIGMMIGKIINPDTPITNPPVTDAPAAKLDLTDIPGSVPLRLEDFSATDNGKYFISPNGSTQNPREWAQNIKENYSAIAGTLLGYTAVTISDGDSYYRLYTLSIQVDEILCNNGSGDVADKEIIEAVYACRYSNQADTTPQPYHPDPKVDTPYNAAGVGPFYLDMGEHAVYYSFEEKQEFKLFYQLEAADGHEITLQNSTLDLSQYADFYMTASFRYMANDPMELCGNLLGGFQLDWIRENPKNPVDPV